MSWSFTLYVVLLVVTGLLAVLVAHWALRQGDQPGGLPLGLLMVAVAQWSLAHAGETLTTSLHGKILWSKIEYIGLTNTPVLALVCALELTRLRVDRPASDVQLQAPASPGAGQRAIGQQPTSPRRGSRAPVLPSSSLIA